MSLIPRNSLFDFDEIFENFYAPHTNKAVSGSFFSPKVDVKEKDNRYEIIADLPGVDKNKLSVTLEGGVLTIEANTEDEKTEKNGGRVIRKERRTGKFLRSFTLGSNVQESDISADFKNGVLTLTVPKLREVSAERKKIDIR